MLKILHSSVCLNTDCHWGADEKEPLCPMNEEKTSWPCVLPSLKAPVPCVFTGRHWEYIDNIMIPLRVKTQQAQRSLPEENKGLSKQHHLKKKNVDKEKAQRYGAGNKCLIQFSARKQLKKKKNSTVWMLPPPHRSTHLICLGAGQTARQRATVAGQCGCERRTTVCQDWFKITGHILRRTIQTVTCCMYKVSADKRLRR